MKPINSKHTFEENIILKKLMLVFILFSFTSCNSQLNGLSSNTDLNSIPSQFEKIDVLKNPLQKLNSNSSDNSNKNKSKDKSNDQSTDSNNVATTISASEFIANANKVMNNEGKKLGTACNVYVQRVLALSGFENSSFVANDFDLYAKKYFNHYKAVNFTNSNSISEINALKKHIWSFPERTPFIFQWSGPVRHGHIAIVERIFDKLVIYQASLGTHTPYKSQTSLTLLLDKGSRRTLTVYSDFY